jgi:DNA-binding response OmpR family regulator
MVSLREFGGTLSNLRNILIIEDNESIGAAVALALTNENYDARHALTGEQGLTMIEESPPALVLCDIMLPGIDGLEVLRRTKSSHPNTQFIMLTARADEIDRVMGLEMGADDYVTKPFSVREVIARVKARLRHLPSSVNEATETFSFSSVTVDKRRRILIKDGTEHRLTTHEAGTLNYLIENSGKDVSRDELLEHVWGYAIALTTRTVDNQILKLRKKIEDIPSEPRHILTVHGTGYRFEP